MAHHVIILRCTKFGRDRGAADIVKPVLDSELVGWLSVAKPIASVAVRKDEMTNYRRNFVAGGSCFFTVNLAERRLQLLTQHVDTCE